MTNKEIMQASLLDIVFDNRNKLYGAYLLRREYPKRLFISIGITLSIIFLFFLFKSFFKQKELLSPYTPDKEIIRLIAIEIPEEIKEPELPRNNIPPVEEPQRQVDYRNYRIVSKEEVADPIPTTDEINESIISNKNVDGPAATKGSVQIPQNPVSRNGNITQEETLKPEKELVFSKTEPEYPGGQDALIRFFQTNLNIPDELEAGKQKTVYIRFKINTEGLVSDMEIATSGEKHLIKK